jgi:hypothetical protein
MPESERLPRLLTRKQLAEMFETTENAIAVKTSAGVLDDLPVVRLGRRLFYMETDVLAFLLRHKGPVRQQAREPAAG